MNNPGAPPSGHVLGCGHIQQQFSIDSEATERDWRLFLHKWERYKDLSLAGSSAPHIQHHLWSCCSQRLEESVFDSGATCHTPESDLLDIIKQKALRQLGVVDIETDEPEASEESVPREDDTESGDDGDMQILEDQIEHAEVPLEAEVKVKFSAEPDLRADGKWSCSLKCISGNKEFWSQKQAVHKHIALKHPDIRIEYFQCKLCANGFQGYRQISCYAIVEHLRIKHGKLEAKCENVLAMYQGNLCKVLKKAQEQWFISTDLQQEHSRCIKGALSQNGTAIKLKRKRSDDPDQEITEKKANPPLDDRVEEAVVSSDLEAAKTLSTMASLEAARSPMTSAADRPLETPVNSPSEPPQTEDLGDLGVLLTAPSQSTVAGPSNLSTLEVPLEKGPGEPLAAPSLSMAGPSNLSTLEGPLEKGQAVVISSTGAAAAYIYSGGCLGEFLAVEGEERERCPVYRQRHTVTSRLHYYLYRTGGWWRVFRTLGSGEMRDCWLRCKAGEASLPPQRGWQFKNHGKWCEDDPSLLLSPGPLSPCTSVTVTSSGRAAGEEPGSLGVFTVVEGEYARGRQVFRQEGGQRLYLRVWYTGRWWICRTLEGEGRSLYSRSSPLCPGHPAAGQDKEGETRGWRCWGSEEWDKTVTVTCTVHRPGGAGEGEGR